MAVLASLLVLAVSGPPAAEATGPAQELRDFVTKVNTILVAGEDRDFEELLTSVVALARPLVAVRHAAESALGGEWQTRTRAEQDEFTSLFATLLERALVFRLAGAAKIGRGVEMSFGEESVVGDLASVRAIAIGKDGQPIPLDYRLVRRGSGWAVRDVVLDGVGIVENYRAQFLKIIRDTSYADLIARLRDKTGAPALPVVMASHAASLPDVIATPPPASPTATVSAPETARERRAEPESKEAAPSHPLRLASLAPVPTLAPTGRATAPLVAVPVSAPPAPVASAPAPVASVPPPVTTVPAPAPITPTPVTKAVAPAASAPRAVATSTSAVVRSKARYWVQVGAFRDIQMATRMVNQLLDENWSVGMAPGDSLTRVRVGPFVDQAEALSTLQSFVSRGFRPFIHTEPAF